MTKSIISAEVRKDRENALALARQKELNKIIRESNLRTNAIAKRLDRFSV